MATDNETVEDIVREMREFGNHCAAFGGAYSPGRWDWLCRRIEAAWKREYDKHKGHVNELNRQILILKQESEKRETYLCGYDPDEALVRQCSTCRYFNRKTSHCSFHDSLTNPKYDCKEWKFKTNKECIEENSKPKRNCDRFCNEYDAEAAWNTLTVNERMQFHNFKAWLFAQCEEGGAK